jgi:hypothetical protein
LTERLLSPSDRPVGVEARTRIRCRLTDGVTAAVGDLPSGGALEVGLPTLRRARSRPEMVGAPEPPFAWKPAFARRSLGLAAVQACVEGRFHAPAAAVGPLAEQAVEEWRRTGWRTFHWEPWFAGLAAGGRAVVLAEAIAWSTPVWAAFDWASLGSRCDIGGPDDWWTCPPAPSARAVRLRGRCELRVHLDGAAGGSAASAPGGGGTALVSVAGGGPGDGSREELAYLALVAGLSADDRPVPARVLGLWPDAAAHRTVEVDECVLTGAADRVRTAVEIAAGRGRSAAAGAPSATGSAVPG